MANVKSATLAKIRRIAPDTSTRWTDAFIYKLILLADQAISEQVGMRHSSQEIALVADTLRYDLNSLIVAVTSVEYAEDGSTYDHYLVPTTYLELDKFSRKWEDDRGSYPERYLLISCPGTRGFTQIMIHRGLSSVSSNTIKVNYKYCVLVEGASYNAATAHDRIIDALYVPYTLGLLYAEVDPSVAAEYMNTYFRNVANIRTQYDKQEMEGYSITRAP